MRWLRNTGKITSSFHIDRTKKTRTRRDVACYVSKAHLRQANLKKISNDR